MIETILDFLPKIDFESFLKATPSTAKELESYNKLRNVVLEKANMLPRVCQFFMTDRSSLLTDEKLKPLTKCACKEEEKELRMFIDRGTNAKEVPFLLVDFTNKIAINKLASRLPTFLHNSGSLSASQIFRVLGEFRDAALITDFVDSEYMSQIGLESLLENFKTAASEDYREVVISLIASRHCLVISFET